MQGTSLQMDLWGKEHDQTPNSSIPDLTCIPHYITPFEETNLLRIIDNQPWMTDLKRRVQHYGYRYDYKARRATEDLKIGELPEWLKSYTEALSDNSLFDAPPDQVIINEYLPGQGISPHIDCVPCFGEKIASLSLGSACIMKFTNTQTHEKIPLLLEPCSLIILSGDARYTWQHGIPARKTDNYHGMKFSRNRRVSLTFRNMLFS